MYVTKFQDTFIEPRRHLERSFKKFGLLFFSFKALNIQITNTRQHLPRT